MYLNNATSLRHRTRSIAAQLSILYAVFTIILLIIAEGMQFWMHVSVSRAADMRFIINEVYILRAALVHAPADIQFLRDEIRLKGKSRRYAGLLVRVMDSHGQILVQTPGMERRIGIDDFPVPVGQDAAPEHIIMRRIAEMPYALVAARAREGDSSRTYTLQVALDRSRTQRAVSRHLHRMMLILALGLLASSILGYALARHGLRPVIEMAGVVQQLGADNMDQRLNIQTWPSELTAFARSFNSMLDRLQDSFTRLARFSANIAHELRTPLHTLHTEAEVALSQPRTLDEYREILVSSLEEYERLGNIVDSLLFLARADAANTVVERSEIDGRAAIEKVIEFFEAVAEEQGVTVACTGNAHLHADLILFRRAISNLLSNALHHTPTGSSILLSLEQDDVQHTRVCVRDTGDGITAEHLPHIFDRFYRTDHTQPGYPRGFGLGLPIVKSIMDLHGGTVTIDSEVGKGTTVTLIFPT